MSTTYKFFFAMLVVAFSGFATIGNAASTNSCEGGSFLGGTCSVNCPTGMVPFCSGGLFSCSCTCVEPATPPDDKLRKMPGITPKLLADSQEFLDWAHNSGSDGLAHLGDLGQQSRSMLIAQNAQGFTAAEKQFGQAWHSLPMLDQAQVSAWRAQHGYGN